LAITFGLVVSTRYNVWSSSKHSLQQLVSELRSWVWFLVQQLFRRRLL